MIYSQVTAIFTAEKKSQIACQTFPYSHRNPLNRQKTNSTFSHSEQILQYRWKKYSNKVLKPFTETPYFVPGTSVNRTWIPFSVDPTYMWPPFYRLLMWQFDLSLWLSRVGKMTMFALKLEDIFMFVIINYRVSFA